MRQRFAHHALVTWPRGHSLRRAKTCMDKVFFKPFAERISRGKSVYWRERRALVSLNISYVFFRFLPPEGGKDLFAAGQPVWMVRKELTGNPVKCFPSIFDLFFYTVHRIQCVPCLVYNSQTYDSVLYSRQQKNIKKSLMRKNNILKFYVFKISQYFCT
jgi:hypothetical protein